MTTTHRTESAHEREIRRAREQFLANTGRHRMTVLLDELDDGRPYRHLRFAKPGTRIWSFDLVTWPGHLAITGDLQSFTFRRLHDMVAFFRSRHRGEPTVNPGYWAEKAVAGTTRGYSIERFAEAVLNEVDQAALSDEFTDADVDALRAAVQEELLDDPPEHAEQAYEAVEDFRWSPDDDRQGAQRAPGVVTPRSDRIAELLGADAPTTAPAVRAQNLSRRALLQEEPSFQFTDLSDLEFHGFDHHYLLSCHAIAWGVGKYLEQFPGRFVPER